MSKIGLSSFNKSSILLRHLSEEQPEGYINFILIY